jgi:hypothetical protein
MQYSVRLKNFCIWYFALFTLLHEGAEAARVRGGIEGLGYLDVSLTIHQF